MTKQIIIILQPGLESRTAGRFAEASNLHSVSSAQKTPAAFLGIPYLEIQDT